MTPERLIEISSKDGIMHEWLADALSMTDQSMLRRWRRGSRRIPDDVAAWLEELHAVIKRQPEVEGWDYWRMVNVRLRWMAGGDVDVAPEVGTWLEAIGEVLDRAPKMTGRTMERGTYVQDGDG
jgi:hypothetical protein